MVHITVLLVSPIQFLDLGPIDLFAMLRRSYFEACNLPSPLLNVALPDEDFQISYVVSPPLEEGEGVNADNGEGNAETKRINADELRTCDTTASVSLVSTHALTSLAVAPGKVDILLIPGPPPGTRPSAATCKWVQAHVEEGKVDLLTVCSGVYVAGFSGVLEGKKATGTRGVMDDLKKSFPGTEWYEDRRWMIDNGGKLWTSGGITNGMDMVAVYLRKRWPGVLSDTVLAMADVEVRPQLYGQSKAGWMGYFGWLVVRAWVGGFMPKKGSGASGTRHCCH
ncbi:unnamed protein product [Periconia digitata]|uniref:DJ-1/PfpI domain-containing protein n=1 Tax=Periconia digitata TaxID=1303443 RepID=A0A9W4U7B4_9PLEO|nr:unnamed protein product [Periconia digitata]